MLLRLSLSARRALVSNGGMLELYDLRNCAYRWTDEFRKANSNQQMPVSFPWPLSRPNTLTRAIWIRTPWNSNRPGWRHRPQPWMRTLRLSEHRDPPKDQRRRSEYFLVRRRECTRTVYSSGRFHRCDIVIIFLVFFVFSSWNILVCVIHRIGLDTMRRRKKSLRVPFGMVPCCHAIFLLRQKREKKRGKAKKRNSFFENIHQT